MKPQSNIFGSIPFLRFTLAFTCGLLTADLFNYTISLTTALIAITALALCFPLAGKTLISNRIFSFFAIVCFIASGALYQQIFVHNQFSGNIPQEGSFLGVILEKAPTTNNNSKYIIKIQQVKTNNRIQYEKEKISLYCADSMVNAKSRPGNIIIFESKLTAIENGKNPGEFDFKRFLQIKGIRYQAYVNHALIDEEEKYFSFKTMALQVRGKLMDMYQNAGITGDELAVLSALTLGDKNLLTNDIRNVFAASGAMHVLAVSGLHVGIIYVILNLLVSYFDKNKYLRKAKVFILLAALWAFAFITGLSPSVMRACSMFSFIVIGENLRKRTNTFNTLAVSAFLLILINPLIIYEVGFQLSYLAVASIVYYQPRLSKLYTPKNKIAQYIWGLLTVSIAAQIGTLPVGLFYFNQFPVYFWLSNFVVIPAAGIILYTSVAFFILGSIPLLGPFISIILNYIVKGLIWCVRYIEGMPGSVIEHVNISLLQTMLIFTLIIFLTLLLIYKRSSSIYYTLAIIILLLLFDLQNEIKSLKQRKIIIYNYRKELLISYIDGKNHYYYTGNDTITSQTANLLKNSTTYFNTYKPEKIKSDHSSVAIFDNLIQIEDKTIGIQPYAKYFRKIEFPVDYLFIHKELIIKVNSRTDISKNVSHPTMQPTDSEEIINLKSTGAFIIDPT
jgi:competence protein ComEC